jgi:hypothetical protein
MRVLKISLCIIGLAPSLLTGLSAISMVGKPAICDKPECQGKTYGAELFVLPASTLAPFVCGILVANLTKDKTRKATGRIAGGKTHETTA